MLETVAQLGHIALSLMHEAAKMRDPNKQTLRRAQSGGHQTSVSVNDDSSTERSWKSKFQAASSTDTQSPQCQEVSGGAHMELFLQCS